MRILYLHQYFATPQSKGGTRSYEFARRLVAGGHSVTMVTSSAKFAPHELSPRQVITRTNYEGIELAILHVPYSNRMSFPARIRAFATFAARAAQEVLRHDADLVFATSTPLTIALPAMLTKYRRRIPMVFEVRDLWPELPIAVGALRNPAAVLAARSLERAAYRASDHIVALSPGMAEGVIKCGIAPERVTVIPNSCDLDLFAVPRERGAAMRAQVPGLAADAPLIVYTGTFGLINGVRYLVDVAAELAQIRPDARIVLIGTGAEREQVIVHAHDRAVLGRNLFVWEPLSKAQMPDLLAAADVATSLFVPIPAMWHNSANKFFDALAAGRPIAINYGGWQADLLREYGAGLVLPPDNPTAAAHELAAFVHDRDGLQRAGAAAQHLARSHFARDLMAERLEAVFRQVVTPRELQAVHRS
ncbi:MAG: glycosyltransferase family 4 protein [Oscillochloris sp.]|nr:glycosyltransferase family 4 protein [Oscillochloris sp.]